MKIKVLATVILAGGILGFSSCQQNSAPSSSVKLNNLSDTISYAWGAATMQGVESHLIQTGILKDTTAVVMQFHSKITSADEKEKAALEKEKAQEISSIVKANKVALQNFLSGLNKGINSKESDKAYNLGLSIGQNIAQNVPNVEQALLGEGQNINTSAVASGMASVVLGTKSALKESPELILQDQEAKLRTKADEEREKAGAANKAKGEEFLANNSKKEGVVTLDNGIQYKVLNPGKPNGKKASKDSGEVVADYKGTLIDGTVFDENEGIPFNLSGVIQGWQEIIPLMPEGAEWEVYIPSDLAYGAHGAGASIGANEVLVFTIKIQEVKK